MKSLWYPGYVKVASQLVIICTAEGLAQLVKRLTAEWEVAVQSPGRTNTQS